MIPTEAESSKRRELQRMALIEASGAARRRLEAAMQDDRPVDAVEAARSLLSLVELYNELAHA